MVQTFLIVLILIFWIFISWNNNLNNIYFQNLEDLKKIETYNYSNWNNFTSFSLEYCEKEKHWGWSNLEGYCIKENWLFIPNWENKNLFVKLILKEVDWVKHYQYINDWFIYIPNKSIIWKVHINEVEFSPNITGLDIWDILVFEITDLNWTTLIENTDSQLISISDNSSKEKVINDILQHLCNDNEFCNGSSNYPWTILNNYYYRISDDKTRLLINLKTNEHQIKNFNFYIQDWNPPQVNYSKWQIEPVSIWNRGF